MHVPGSGVSRIVSMTDEHTSNTACPDLSLIGYAYTFRSFRELSRLSVNEDICGQIRHILSNNNFTPQMITFKI